MTTKMVKCEIIGNLGRDAECRTINRSEYYSISVGVKRRKDEQALWIQVMYPRRTGTLDSLLRKGRQLYARGDMQVGAFTRRDGSVEPAVTVWAQELQLLSAPDAAANVSRTAPGGTDGGHGEVKDDLPF